MFPPETYPAGIGALPKPDGDTVRGEVVSGSRGSTRSGAGPRPTTAVLTDRHLLAVRQSLLGRAPVLVETFPLDDVALVTISPPSERRMSTVVFCSRTEVLLSLRTHIDDVEEFRSMLAGAGLAGVVGDPYDLGDDEGELFLHEGERVRGVLAGPPF